jgi:hypothetical protein
VIGLGAEKLVGTQMRTHQHQIIDLYCIFSPILFLRSGFTAYFVLSPVTGFLATVTSLGLILRNLAPAPGRQDHTTSPSATITLVSRDISVHRIPPRVRDVRTPLLSGETRGVVALICPTG